MKEIIDTLRIWLGPLRADERIGPVDLCIYLALLHLSGGSQEWFFVEKGTVMWLAKVKGQMTYYQSIGKLAALGYVEYWASKNTKTKSRVKLVRWDANGK